MTLSIPLFFSLFFKFSVILCAIMNFFFFSNILYIAVYNYNYIKRCIILIVII